MTAVVAAAGMAPREMPAAESESDAEIRAIAIATIWAAVVTAVPVSGIRNRDNASRDRRSWHRSRRNTRPRNWRSNRSAVRRDSRRGRRCDDWRRDRGAGRSDNGRCKDSSRRVARNLVIGIAPRNRRASTDQSGRRQAKCNQTEITQCHGAPPTPSRPHSKMPHYTSASWEASSDRSAVIDPRCHGPPKSDPNSLRAVAAQAARTVAANTGQHTCPSQPFAI